MVSGTSSRSFCPCSKLRWEFRNQKKYTRSLLLLITMSSNAIEWHFAWGRNMGSFVFLLKLCRHPCYRIFFQIQLSMLKVGVLFFCIRKAPDMFQSSPVKTFKIADAPHWHATSVMQLLQPPVSTTVEENMMHQTMPLNAVKSMYGHLNLATNTLESKHSINECPL